MNIFFLSSNPYTAAEYHCDIHLNKMIIEACQMMSTAVRLQHGKQQKLWHNEKRKFWYTMPSDVIEDNTVIENYWMAVTHPNHPCTQWVSKSMHNFAWVYTLAEALDSIRQTELKSAPHNSLLKIEKAIELQKSPLFVMANHSLATTPALAMPSHHIVYKNPVQSYRNYYRAKLSEWLKTPGKEKYARYTNRQTPSWLEDIYHETR